MDPNNITNQKGKNKFALGNYFVKLKATAINENGRFAELVGGGGRYIR